MAKLVVVGGGSGFIGKALCTTLEKSGYTTTIVSRSTQGKRNAITWDEIRRNGLPAFTHAVINLAGEPALSGRRWSEELKADVRKSRIDTTQLLKKSILSCETPPKFWATISGVGFYPSHSTNVYDETSTVVPVDFWTRLTKDWEDASELPKDSCVRRCIVRSGIVLSKHGGPLQNMWLPYKLGLGGPIGSGDQWFPWIHIDDMVGIFLHALGSETVTGILNGVAPDAKTNKEFSNCFAATLHRPTFFSIPSFVIRALLGSPRADLLLEGPNVYPKRTLESGYKYAFPTLPQAFQDIASV